MDDMQRRALEQEFEEKRERLTAMQEQIPAIQADYEILEAALRARAVKEAENAAKEETEEVERMSARCQRAQNDLDAALAAGDEARKAACRETLEAERLALDFAERRMQDAKRAYENALIHQGFADEQAYREAFLAKPVLLKLEERVEPFRAEYASLLGRCKEIVERLEA